MRYLPTMPAAVPGHRRAPQHVAPEDVFGYRRRGRRPDLGNTCFRSSWEANYARYLRYLQHAGLIVAWEYEPDTFVFPGGNLGPTSYTPDFKVTEPGGRVVYHEVKGWLDAGSRARMRRLQRFYPEIELVVIGPKEYETVGEWAGRIDGWE